MLILARSPRFRACEVWSLRDDWTEALLGNSRQHGRGTEETQERSAACSIGREDP